MGGTVLNIIHVLTHLLPSQPAGSVLLINSFPDEATEEQTDSVTHQKSSSEREKQNVNQTNGCEVYILKGIM